ncbi:MAG: hypothetical protein JWN32_3677 [Solirubrobacterales bacterium]|nr:hypothetical protein [Solirubrobacterales bacterium]
MAPRSRKKPAGSGGTATRATVSRSEVRNAAVRATLAPYEPGERPLPVTIAAAVAVVLAVANLGLMASGYKIHGHGNPVLGGLLFAAIMLGAAAGMWRMRYWAVLGFEAVLGVAIVVFALFLVRASNLFAVVLCLAVIGFGGRLFWKLVRVMSRMQAPARPAAP